MFDESKCLFLNEEKECVFGKIAMNFATDSVANDENIINGLISSYFRNYI